MNPTTRDAVRVERLTLHAADGYPLSARRYHAAIPPRAHLVVGGATAVPQGFYKRFAQHMATQGVDVLTLDYRGIGDSAPRSLKGFRMDYLDWGRLDLAAGVAHMRAPGVPLWLVGHSYGGHALGLLPHPEQVDAAFPAGSMTGAPKLSAMTILHRLERRPRGVFAGCFGWVGVDGGLDLAMVIRSIVVHRSGAYVGAGGGITWGSVAADEVAEVGVKARAPLAALGAALPPGW